MTQISINAVPVQLRIVWTETGVLQGADVILTVPGTTTSVGPLGLLDVANNPILQSALGAANVAAIAQKELLEQQVAQLQSDKLGLTAERDTAIAQLQQTAAEKDEQIAVLQVQNTDLQSQVNSLEQQINDLQNPPQPTGEWGTFRAAITDSDAYLRIAGFNGATTVLASQLIWAIGSQTFAEVPALWNKIAAIASPTPEEITELNDLATQCQVPFALNPQGLMG